MQSWYYFLSQFKAPEKKMYKAKNVVVFYVEFYCEIEVFIEIFKFVIALLPTEVIDFGVIVELNGINLFIIVMDFHQITSRLFRY